MSLLSKTSRRVYHHSHFTNEEAETQRGDVPFSRSRSWEGAELEFEPIPSLYVPRVGEA